MTRKATMAEVHELWAQTHVGGPVTRREFGSAEHLIAKAEKLARTGGGEGAVGIAVFAPDGAVVWAAGEEVSRA